MLEPRIDHWRPGPQLTQARADAAALRLADGSVLVAGGWSRAAQGALAVTASSEIWHGGSRFEATAPMPIPDRRQRPLRLAGSPIDTPLLFNPYSGIVQGYDPQQRRWQLAAELPQFADQIIGPLSSARGAFLWAGKIASSGRQWLRIPLRLPSASSVAGAARHDPAQGVPFRRHRVGLLAGDAQRPTLVVGGEVWINELGHREAYTTAAVVAIEHDGRTRNLPSLNHPRTGATVLRLVDGSLLVAGGRGSEPEVSLPLEWLPSDDPPADEAWRIVADTPTASGWGQDANSGLLAVSEDGEVWRGQLQLDVEGQPRFAGQALPQLPLPRTSDHNNVQTVPAIHELADGRILVTGGMSARLRVAGLDPSLEEQPPADNEDAECQGFVRGRDMEAVAMDASPAADGEADAQADYGWVLPEHCWTPALHVDPDGSIRLDALAYADRGERDLPYGFDDLANDYAIYDPAHGRWRYSARGEGNGYGEMAVLRDGRVVRSLSLPPPADQPDGEYRQLLGLSSADGRSWDNLALQGPMPELWSQGGELFGLRGDDEGAQELLWLDLETRSWVRLPHWKRDDRAQEASFVLFQTSLADGRRLWLPDRMPR